MSKTENPFAFPQPYDRAGDGMTLRDWFAGQAIAGILAANAPCGEEADKIMATSAYIMADAMLAERSRS